MPASALAGTAQVGGGVLSYTANAGEQNDVTLKRVGDTYVVIDRGTAPAALPPCSPSVDPRAVNCPAAGIVAFDVAVGDGDDTVVLCGTVQNEALEPDDCKLASSPGGAKTAPIGDFCPVLVPTVDDPRPDQTICASIDGGTGKDTLTGSDGPDRIIGGPAGEGDDADVIDGGLGPDNIEGGAGGTGDTMSYRTRMNPVGVHMAPTGGPFGGEGCDQTQADCFPATCDDPTRATCPPPDRENDFPLSSIEHLVGGSGDDRLGGSETGNILNGGPAGSDTLCGNLGPDTVDYSDRTRSVRVSLEGDPRLPTDADLQEGRPGTSVGPARRNCFGRPDFSTPTDDPNTPVDERTTFPERGLTDCLPNDGEIDIDPGTAGNQSEGDCVGEDVENVSGGQVDDVLIGNDGPASDCPLVTIAAGAPGATGGTYTLSIDGRSTAPIAYNADFAAIQSALEALRPDPRPTVTSPVLVSGGPLFGSGAAVVVVKLRGWVNGRNVPPIMVDAAGVTGPGSPYANPASETSRAGLCVGPKIEPLGANRLQGNGGNDLLDGRTGADIFEGGFGEDTVTYEDRTEPIVGTINGTQDDGGASDVEPITGRRDSIVPAADTQGIENVIGGAGDDQLGGNERNNRLEGRGGNDQIEGGDESGPGVHDNLLGGTGDDLIQGQAGHDVLAGEQGNDTLKGNAGSDGLDGGADTDVLSGGPDPDSLSGGDGTDTLDYSDALTPVSVTPDGSSNDGTPGESDGVAGDIESLVGGADDDVLVGNGGNGTIDGRAGDDKLDGGGGADNLIGRSGFDSASYESRSAPVNVNIGVPGGDGEAGENDNVSGDVQRVIGGYGNDTIVGDSDANILRGESGNDKLSGGAGFDQLNGGTGQDELDGESGDDLLFGGLGHDSLKGGSGSDVLNGGDDNDQLDGGAGADSLNGDDNDDTAVFSTRTRSVRASVEGSPDDGEAREGDNIKTDVENVRTGSGNDRINTLNGLKNKVNCGRGRDRVTADRSDVVAADCEDRNVGALSRCRIARGAVRMGRAGRVTVRVRCPFAANGTLRLKGAGSGSKRFSVRAGKAKKVKVKLSGKARRAVRRNKRLRVRAIATIRPRGRATRSSRQRVTKKLTIRAPRGKKR
jgi:Ca2+-binding RTX toxin-like protein